MIPIRVAHLDNRCNCSRSTAGHSVSLADRKVEGVVARSKEGNQFIDCEPARRTTQRRLPRQQWSGPAPKDPAGRHISYRPDEYIQMASSRRWLTSSCAVSLISMCNVCQHVYKSLANNCSSCAANAAVNVAAINQSDASERPHTMAGGAVITMASAFQEAN